MPTPVNNAQINEVTLLVAGEVHGQWMEYDLASDLMTPADDFVVSLGRPHGNVPDSVQPGADVQVRIGEDTVMTGKIDDVDISTEKGQQTLNIRGRDAAAVLLDCSCPIFDAQEMDLKQIIEKIVKPMGIVKISIDAEQTNKKQKVQIEPGMRAWDALQRYCEDNGLWPWMEPDGTLVVGGPDYSTDPVADLIIRKNGEGNNVVHLDYRRSMAKRYSEVTVLGQNHSGKNALKVTVKDEAVKIHRPLIVVEPDVDTEEEARKRGRKLLSDSRLDGLSLDIEVKGHRNENGVLWMPGQRIHVLSEPDGIDAIFFLMSRTFRESRFRSKHTILNLKEDGAWVLDAKPSKQKSNKKRRDKTAAKQLKEV